MKPNHTTALQRVTGRLASAAVLLLLATVSPARAGIIIPELSVVGGTGVPASTVSVTLALADDITETASSADMDLIYPPDLLTFSPPVTESCAVDPRLAENYAIGGRLDGEGVVILSIFVKGTPPVIPHLGNGPLASCDFFINAGVPVGTAALIIENAALFDSNGDPLNVNTKNGSIVISNATPTFTPTATPTTPPTSTVTVTRTPTATATVTGTKVATNTPTVTATTTNTKPTATATNTPPTPPATSTATNTPQNTPTATRTGGTPTATKTGGGGGGGGGGCDIVPVEQSTSSGTLALLLAPALLVWARRRRL